MQGYVRKLAVTCSTGLKDAWKVILKIQRKTQCGQWIRYQEELSHRAIKDVS